MLSRKNIYISIAIILLSLLILFTFCYFNKPPVTVVDWTEEVRSQIFNQLNEPYTKLTIHKNISLGAGDTGYIAIGIKNTKESNLNYRILINRKQVENSQTSIKKFDWFKFDGGWSLSPFDSNLKTMKITIPKVTEYENYIFNLAIIDKDQDYVYAEKEFSIEVKYNPNNIYQNRPDRFNIKICKFFNFFISSDNLYYK